MKSTQKAQGFTIVELLISIALFAILIPSLSSFMNFLTQLNSKARTVATINAMAENKIESLRSAGYVATTTGANQPFAPAEIPETIPSPKSAVYSVTQTEPSLKKIEVVVTYNNGGTPESLKYVTYMGELGVGQY